MSHVARSRFPWWMAVLGVALLGAIVISVSHVQLPSVPTQVAKRKATQITVTKLRETPANAAINEQASLLDPTPLFLPTPYNTSLPEVKLASRRDLGSELKSFPPRLTNPDTALPLSSDWPIALPAATADVLNLGVEPNPYQGLAQTPALSQPLPARAALIEFVDLYDGRPIFAQEELSWEKLGELSPAELKPLELLIKIQETGIVGTPIVVLSSGSAKVDQIFRKYVSQIARLGHRISPGIYKLRIGP